MELTITISSICILFFLLFCFIKPIRTPMTLLLIPVVTGGILTSFIDGLSSTIALIIGVVVSITVCIVSIILKKKTNTNNLMKFFFGFCLMYLSFIHLFVIADAVLNIIGKENILMTKLVNNELPVDTIVLEVVVALLFGLFVRLTSNTLSAPFISFIGGFMIVVFAIDAFSGNTNHAILFSSENFKFNILNYLENINLKNIELYSKTVLDADFLHIYIALAFALPISICATILTKREDEIF